MGAPTTRIMAADFLIPPELRGLSLAANPAGRIGGLRLQVAACRGATRLAACYQQIPLRVLPPFQMAENQPALLYLLNPTAGLMDGDGQRIDLEAGPCSRTVVTGQSATRIHPSVQSFATQQWHVHVAQDALLVVLPGPAIPFAGCRYFQRAAIDLAPGAGFVWGDIWLSGRYARGEVSEQFQFSTLIQELSIRRGNQLAFRDRFCWRGPWDRDTAAWHFGGAQACGSLFVTGKIEPDLIPDLPGVKQAHFPTAAGDTCLRWLGPSETVANAVVQTGLRAAASLQGQRNGKPWLLESGGLAPNHWFSLMPEDVSSTGKDAFREAANA
jgi:urease accessory protein